MVYSVGDLVEFEFKDKVRQGTITKIKYHAFEEDEFVIKDKDYYCVAASKITRKLKDKWD